MQKRPIPPALRSRLHLAQREPIVEAAAAPAPPLSPRGITYTMAQEATWIDEEHFAVGRWDGSLEIFSFTDSASQGPLINCAVNTPAQEGVQMITPLGADSFASSNDDRSIAIWQTRTSSRWADAAVSELLRYDAALGAANSAASIEQPGAPSHLLAGHASGFVSIWVRADVRASFRLVTTVDLRAAQPTNPWGIHNIRGIDIVDAALDSRRVVTGSEDGDLIVLAVPSGQMLSRVCYNPSAQRGINSLAVREGVLLVANCAVGREDHNLWAYRIDQDSSRIHLLDAANLALGTAARQMFNFDVAWGELASGAPAFFSSTEEGILWMGVLNEQGKIGLLGHVPVTRSTGADQVLQLGSAVCYSGSRVVVANYDIAQFAVVSDP